MLVERPFELEVAEDLILVDVHEYALSVGQRQVSCPSLRVLGEYTHPHPQEEVTVHTSTVKNPSPIITFIPSPTSSLTTSYPSWKNCRSASSHSCPRNPAPSLRSSIMLMSPPAFFTMNRMASSVRAMLTGSRAHWGDEVRWPELSYPF